jgi:two-component system, NtrC family, sensor kinase
MHARKERAKAIFCNSTAFQTYDSEIFRLDSEKLPVNQMSSKAFPLLSRRSRTMIVTALGLSLVLGLGLWDAHHEDAMALRQLMHEHHLLAATLSTYIELNADSARVNSPSQSVDVTDYKSTPFGRATFRVERDQGFIVLLMDPVRGQYLTTQARWIHIPELESARSHGEEGALLSRDAAVLLGLPRRTAVAGLASLREKLGRTGAVAVVTSAEAERDRSRRDQWRSVLGLALTSGLILLAAVGALRSQKRELDLERQRALHKMERARDAELARANRMATIAALSSGIAHEISTPLGVIAGRMEQLQVAVQGQERYERVAATISTQINRIDQIMRGFLAFAQGEAPILTIRTANEVARNAFKLVQYRFAIADVVLEFHPCSNDNLPIACEPALFEQALIDILINALEASSPKQRVTLSVHYDQSTVAFVVLDEGIGISESVIARATEPFFTTKAGKGGSGLGLAIAKEILTHHRGEIAFDLRQTSEGNMQQGTRVTVQLPRAKEVPVESK